MFTQLRKIFIKSFWLCLFSFLSVCLVFLPIVNLDQKNNHPNNNLLLTDANLSTSEKTFWKDKLSPLLEKYLVPASDRTVDKLTHDENGESRSDDVDLTKFLKDNKLLTSTDFTDNAEAKTELDKLTNKSEEQLKQMFDHTIDHKFNEIWQRLQPFLEKVDSLFTELTKDEENKSLSSNIKINLLVDKSNQKPSQLDKEGLIELNKFKDKTKDNLEKMFNIKTKSSLLDIFKSIRLNLFILRSLWDEKVAPLATVKPNANLTRELVASYNISKLLHLELKEVEKPEYTFSVEEEKQLRQLNKKESDFNRDIQNLFNKINDHSSQNETIIIIVGSTIGGIAVLFAVIWGIFYYLSTRKS